jgi:1,4-alpha-glucan branching enzyme
MNSKQTLPFDAAGSTAGYSARRSNHSVAFFLCSAPQAKNVSLIGDFNDWRPAAHPMQRMPDGCWATRLELRHGSHRYLFLVDGKPALDPHAQGIARHPNAEYEAASLMIVS